MLRARPRARLGALLQRSVRVPGGPNAAQLRLRDACLKGAAWLCHHCTQIHGMGKHTQGDFSGCIRAHRSFWF